jgi:hypothetical protein
LRANRSAVRSANRACWVSSTPHTMDLVVISPPSLLDAFHEPSA